MFEHLAQDTSSAGFFVWNAILGCVAVGGAVAAIVYHRRARAMTATPTSRIGSAAGGTVEFEGRAKAVSETPLKGPLTGTPCVWYEYEVTRQMGGHGRHHHSQWVTVDRGRSEDLFLLADESGECLVDPDGAKVVTAPADTDRWLGRSERPAHGPTRRGSRWGLFPGQSYSTFGLGRGLWFSTRRDYRYTERRIRPGAPLYALGHLFREGGGSGSPGASTSEVLRSWKQDQTQLLRRFDADGDGQIDADEWDAARREAQAQVARERSRSSGARDPDLLGAPRDRSCPFLISAIPQQVLIARYRVYTGMGAVAAVLGAVGVGALIAAG